VQDVRGDELLRDRPPEHPAYAADRHVDRRPGPIFRDEERLERFELERGELSHALAAKFLAEGDECGANGVNFAGRRSIRPAIVGRRVLEVPFSELADAKIIGVARELAAIGDPGRGDAVVFLDGFARSLGTAIDVPTVQGDDGAAAGPMQSKRRRLWDFDVREVAFARSRHGAGTLFR